MLTEEEARLASVWMEAHPPDYMLGFVLWTLPGELGVGMCPFWGEPPGFRHRSSSVVTKRTVTWPQLEDQLLDLLPTLVTVIESHGVRVLFDE